MTRAGAALVVAGLASCSPAAGPAPPPAKNSAARDFASDAIAPSRVAFTTEVAGGCDLVLPFYEGLELDSAANALRSVKSESLDLAYPGALSLPLVAWRCDAKTWTAMTTTSPLTTPISLQIRPDHDQLALRLECFGACTFRKITSTGSATDLAKAVAHAMNLHAKNPPLASRYSKMDFFVRSWVANDALPALRTDWAADALLARLKSEPSTTMSFVFGLDPNEVDLGGHYFWAEGADAEIHGIFQANPGAAQFHWLNLRSYKTEIPRLGITQPLTPELQGAVKVTASGTAEFDQYVFKATEMCLAAQPWQDSRIAELKKLLDLGFKVIALDEYPVARTWSAEPCRAKNHRHRPGDFADEQRLTIELLGKLAELAHARGALLSSEEPSLTLLPFTSGYMDGAFDEPPDVYDHWVGGAGIKIVPLFSTMFGTELTPYTRPASAHHVPAGWMVQDKISASH